MIRGGGKREDGVKRQAKIRNLQIARDQLFRALKESTDVFLDADAVERCSSSTRGLQSKHDFMAYPERGDVIEEHRNTLRWKKHQSSELRNRITEAEAEQLKDESYVLAEITHDTKATRLAENLFDLYTLEYTNLFDATRAKLHVKHPTEIITGGVRDIIELCYNTCRDFSNKQRLRMNDILHLDVKGVTMTPPLELRIKESQMNMSPFSLSHVNKIIKADIAKNYNSLMKRLNISPYKTPLIEFLERCTELIWFSQIREPPVIMEFSLLSDMSLYEPFTDRGPTIDHVVWPVLFLYEDGPVLAKGVARFNEEM